MYDFGLWQNKSDNSKQVRNKKNPSDVFIASSHFVEEVAIVKRNFGEQLYQQLKQLITKFADIIEKPHGLPPN